MQSLGSVYIDLLFSLTETGKTSTAKKMGQVYFDMGLLASTEVIETSARDLVG